MYCKQKRFSPLYVENTYVYQFKLQIIFIALFYRFEGQELLQSASFCRVNVIIIVRRVNVFEA